MGRRTRCQLLAGLFVALLAAAAGAQEIVLDQPVRAGGLIFFPSVADPNAYYYAPTRARLATGEGEGGKPQFSFLRYVENVNTAGKEQEEGEGGGIVHAVVQLGVTEDELRDAQSDLRRVAPGGVVKGPVVFRSGKFGLVSSFQEGSDLVKRVVGLGTAPILDGSKAAISIQLTKQGSKILWQSFQTATPDVSFLFEMEMAGYRSPKRALIEAELDRVYEHSAFQAGVATTYVQAEITQALDDLYQKGAIKLTQVGEDEKLDALVQTAYSKLTELVFQPMSPQGAEQIANAAGGKKSALDRASELLEKRREEVRKDNAAIRSERARREEARAARLNRAVSETRKGDDPAITKLAKAEATHRAESAARADATAEPAAAGDERQEQALPEFAAVVTYEMKRSRQRGVYRVDLNKWTADKLSLRFDENIGDLRRYTSDPAVFRNVNLDDPLFKQREIIASLVGVSADDFGSALNFVSLQLVKKHESGEETTQEARIDREKFNATGNAYKLVYGWKGDDDRRKWRSYDYRVLWSFGAGAGVEEPWKKGEFNAIPLAPPFRKRSLQLEADKAVLEGGGVRSATVQVFSKVGSEDRVAQVTLDTSKGELSKTLDFIAPVAAAEYEYEIKYRLRGNKTLATGRKKTDQEILYLDELPEAQ
jgi:hypothetical protein